MNRLAIDRFRFGLQWCLAKAVDMGMDIAITPHLDDGLERGNLLKLYPAKLPLDLCVTSTLWHCFHGLMLPWPHACCKHY